VNASVSCCCGLMIEDEVKVSESAQVKEQESRKKEERRKRQGFRWQGSNKSKAMEAGAKTDTNVEGAFTFSLHCVAWTRRQRHPIIYDHNGHAQVPHRSVIDVLIHIPSIEPIALHRLKISEFLCKQCVDSLCGEKAIDQLSASCVYDPWGALLLQS